MDIFQSQQRVEVYLLAETNRISGEAFRMTKYVCQHTDIPNELPMDACVKKMSSTLSQGVVRIRSQVLPA